MSSINILKSVVFVVIMTLAGFFGILYAWLLLFPLFFLKPRMFRLCIDYALGSWCNCVSGLLELFIGIKVKVTGDFIRPGERNLIMMNHRTRLDWMFFWNVLVRQSGTTTEKIILKSPLKKIPGFGWAMQVGSLIFIERNWEEDKKILTKMIDYFIGLKHKTQILLFPEGTDLTARTKTKSDEFARKNNVKPYNYVLHPRTTGFTFIAQYMRQREFLDALYDVTIAYPQNIPQKEIDLITDSFPREVHFHIKRHAVQSLPLSEEDLASWCKTRWEEKEDRLKLFYEKKTFDDTPDVAIDNVNGKSENVNNDVNTNAQSDAIKTERMRQEARGRFIMKVMVTCWVAFIVIILVLLYTSSMARWLVLAEMIMFVIVTNKYGGFEFLQADYFKWFYRNTNRVKKVE